MNVLLNVVLIFAVVAVDSIASRATGSQSSDIILGPRSPHRVRIHSSMASGSQFRWSGENIISRIEIFRQFEHSSRAPQINIMDGLHSNRVHLFTSNGAPIDAWVSIYSVPRNMTLGTPAANAQRVHTERVTGRGLASMSFTSGTGTITHVNLLDQTNGTGSFVRSHRGILRQEFFVSLGSPQRNGIIDYIVDVFSRS